ncbi:MAG: sigma-54-dependent Fis family transcriptional regulator [Gammaproteobacteria bacterium]|nr:sigma-54-dependent Fis family transcriptional regulator [Gammaproteobacteria bacterium]
MTDLREQEQQPQVRVLLVDDEAPVRKATGQWLSLAGFSVETFSQPQDLLEQVDRQAQCVVVSDIKMPGMDGMELAQHIRESDPDLPVILVTAHGDIQMAVEAMRNGAYDFIEKPFEPNLLIDRIQRAWEKRQLVLENRKLRNMVKRGARLEDRLLGHSAAIKRLRQEILLLTETPVDVVIHGATGTGKELAARCLHEWSPRSSAPFVAVNCGAIPENLFESELFGHEAGSFTGAQGKRIGKLEYAQGGVLFLDEIESMPMGMQIKLLRVLQERKLERIGSNREIVLDLWVIAATKTDLRQASDRGEFREDLYYRFNVAELRLPTMAQRREDIPLLFHYYAQKAAYQYERPFESLPEEAAAALMAHEWPGNVRELKNMAERYVLGIGANSTLWSLLGRPGEPPLELEDKDGLSEKMQRYEQGLITQALTRHQGNMQAVMTELDIPRRTLNNKMTQYGIKRQTFL